MLIKMIDMAIADYAGKIDEGDAARLGFFRKIWGAQDALIQKAGKPEYDMPSPQALSAWNQAGESVLSHKPVAVDPASLADACRAVAACIAEQGVLVAEVNEGLTKTDWDALLEKADMSLAGSEPAAFVQDMVSIASEGNDVVVADAIAMVVSLALRTQLEGIAADIYKAIIDAEADVPRPVNCPVCGGMATLARVGVTRSKNGRAKELWCSQCGTAWEFERVRCGRCGTQNQSRLHYFSLEGDDAHRLQSCDECGSYIRTLYQEGSVAPFSYEVEDVVMAKLDIVAYNQAKAQAEAE